MQKCSKRRAELKCTQKDAECEILAEHIDALYEDKRLETDITGAIIDAETMADDASSTLLDIRRKNPRGE
ncbi:MAG: hypothetical protein L6V93_18895 [Clostridiales bacterium]|nr:MAG: hypothetical protein L6V93_18895 [Clostridiales bacterium]